MFRVKLFKVGMKRVLLIPVIGFVVTLASSLYVWNYYTWGFVVLGYGYPLPWLNSFTSGGTHWAMNAAGFAVDYLLWLAVGTFFLSLHNARELFLQRSS